MTKDSDEPNYIGNDHKESSKSCLENNQLTEFRALLARDSVFSVKYNQYSEDDNNHNFSRKIMFDKSVLNELNTSFKPWSDTLIPTVLRGTVIPLPIFLKIKDQKRKFNAFNEDSFDNDIDMDSNGGSLNNGNRANSSNKVKDYYKPQSETRRRKRQPKGPVERRERSSRLPTTFINPNPDFPSYAVKIDPHFVPVLKEHQLEGVRYIWDCTVAKHEGCILAHSMGLGKTLQTIVFVTTLIQQISRSIAMLPKYLHSKRILILAPTIALDNWVNEFERWLSPDLQNIVGHAVNFNDPGLVNISLSRRMIFLDRWFVHGGILLMSYDQFRCLLKPTQIPLELEKLEKYLLNPGPSVLIADEGHRIKNSQAVITTLVNRINTPARVCLTGYPLQNNLAEYYHILDFASPGLFGSPNSFKNTYQKVIESTYADSSKSQLYMAKHALYQLHLLSSSCIHRKDASILKAELPPKVEYVINCKLLEVQHSLYIRMLEELRIASLNPLIGLILLRAICNHPFVFFKMSNNRKLPVQRKLTIPKLNIKVNIEEDPENIDELDESEYINDNENENIINNNIIINSNSNSNSNSNNSGTISEDKTENTVGDVTGDATGNNNDNNTDPTEESSELLDDQIEAFDPNEIAEVESWKNTKALQWVTDAFKPLIDTWEMSSKMRIIMDIVKYASEIGDKVLIVSHSLLCLDYIGETLNTMGYKTLRIDGTTPQPVRQPCIDQFNDDPNEQTMLISARAGSIGVNIVGANRVILCDYDWNPCHEEQSIGRVYRYGQLKRVYIYRLVTNGTIEERLLNQGIHKRGISSRVIDNKRMTPQLEQDMKKYYSEPQKSYDPLKSDLGFDVDDPVMKKVIEGLRDCIANIRLGDSLTEPGFDNSPEVSKSDITKIKLEVYRIRSVHLRDVIRKYGR